MRILARPVALAALLAALSGCGLVDQAERSVEDAASAGVERAIGGRVQQELERAGIKMQGKVDCDSDVSLGNVADGVDGTVTCSGKTEDGDAVKASFDGTLSGDGTCRGSVVVTVGGKERLRTPETNVCAQQQ